MTRYRQSLVLFFAFVIAFELFVASVGDLHRSHWGDEWHFQNTIKLFGEAIDLDNITHYQEMSTPLPFVLYALWGRIVGFELFDLRILSIIIAIVTYLAFHRLLFLITENTRATFWASTFLVVHPYMVGFSIFVYTDMLAILFLVVSCLAVLKRNSWMLGLALALAVLSRQYIAFFTLAAGLYYLAEYFRSRKSDTLRMLIAVVLSAVPFAALVVLWRGTSPDNSLRAVYLDEGFYYHPIVLTLYLSLLFYYHLPLIVFFWRKFYTDYRMLAIGLVCSAFYLFFPVAPTKPSIDVGKDTVGLFHRLVKFMLVRDLSVQIVFYAGFLLSLPILYFIIKDCYGRWRSGRIDIALLLDLAILSFFIVMPFSYLGWEKYFLPVVPLVTARVLMIRKTSETSVSA